MEPNNYSEPVTTPTVTSTEVPTPPANQLPKPSKSFLSRIIRDMLVIGAVIICLGVGFGIYAITSVGKAIIKVPSACTSRENRIQSASDSLKTILGNATINNLPPTSLTARADKDCLDGSGNISSTASFRLAAADISSANAVVLQSLKLQNTNAQSFSVDNGGDYTYNNDTTISFVTTRLGANGNTTYTADYWLVTPVVCASYGTRACKTGSAAIQAYGLLQKPVSKVTIIVSSTAN